LFTKAKGTLFFVGDNEVSALKSLAAIHEGRQTASRRKSWIKLRPPMQKSFRKPAEYLNFNWTDLINERQKSNHFVLIRERLLMCGGYETGHLWEPFLLYLI